MSFALPETMRDYIDTRVRSGQYGNTSEYLRDLIRQDQRSEAARRLSELIADGLASGPARPFTHDVLEEIRVRSSDDDQ